MIFFVIYFLNTLTLMFFLSRSFCFIILFTLDEKIKVTSFKDDSMFFCRKNKQTIVEVTKAKTASSIWIHFLIFTWLRRKKTDEIIKHPTGKNIVRLPIYTRLFIWICSFPFVVYICIMKWVTIKDAHLFLINFLFATLTCID